jgi:RND family efflux transporter MFP subunit
MHRSALAAVAIATLAACSGSEPEEAAARTAPAPAGTPVTVVAEDAPDYTEASGVAHAIQQSTLSTKLMGTVLQVAAREGDAVAAGAPLVRLDAADLAARRQQVAAGVAQGQAGYAEAETNARRMRALYAEEAAPRAQLDAAEAALARAAAGVRAARAGGAELSAVESYSVIRAPFAGVVVQRMVDPGAFAAPGAPLMVVQDASRLRVTASAPPETVRGLRRGETIGVRIEGRRAEATVEGVVPAPTGEIYTVNAILENADGRFMPGSAATLLVPRGVRPTLLVPAAAVMREGDLTGVVVLTPGGSERRWVRLGRAAEDGRIEVLSGLRAGETVLVPAAPGGE